MIDFDDMQPRVRQPAIEEFGERAGAESDQQHCARPQRPVLPQQAGEHLARVFELERVGLAYAHRALNPVGAEMQTAHAGFFADVEAVCEAFRFQQRRIDSPRETSDGQRPVALILPVPRSSPIRQH